MELQDWRVVIELLRPRIVSALIQVELTVETILLGMEMGPKDTKIVVFHVDEMGCCVVFYAYNNSVWFAKWMYMLIFAYIIVFNGITWVKKITMGEHHFKGMLYLMSRIQSKFFVRWTK